MTLCYLGLGSNLRCPTRQLNQAIAALRRVPHTIIVKCSQVYINPPMGLKAQPMFHNMVVGIHTKLSPHRLLDYCQQIEQRQQRIRQKRWGARTLDIDILLYGEQMISTPRLSIPHPGMLERDFVLIPLREITHT